MRSMILRRQHLRQSFATSRGCGARSGSPTSEDEKCQETDLRRAIVVLVVLLLTRGR